MGYLKKCRIKDLWIKNKADWLSGCQISSEGVFCEYEYLWCQPYII